MVDEALTGMRQW